MELDGIHHITCITADAPGNVDFYARLLGLRCVKKTVNFDAPDVYHLYYGDERGAPGSILTFFEFPDAAPGRAGSGMIHRLRWRVGSRDALAFWSERLAAEGVGVGQVDDADAIRFSDPEGLGLELAVSQTGDEPLTAWAEDIPAEHALPGVRRRPRVRPGARAGARDPDRHDGLRADRARRVSPHRAPAQPPTATTTRPRRSGCRAPAPCTTSPGATATTSTPPGAVVSPPPASGPRR